MRKKLLLRCAITAASCLTIWAALVIVIRVGFVSKCGVFYSKTLPHGELYCSFVYDVGFESDFLVDWSYTLIAPITDIEDACARRTYGNDPVALKCLSVVVTKAPPNA